MKPAVPLLLVQLPLTVNELVPENARLAPVLIVKLLHNAGVPAAIAGGYGVDARMVTLVVASGTEPVHQLDPVFQSVLVAPVQEPGAHDPVVVTFNVPVAVVPK